MNLKLTKTPSNKVIEGMPSKSVAHRMLICSALSCLAEGAGEEAFVSCLAFINDFSNDIKATKGCLRALYQGVNGGSCLPDAGESGSTLRFLVPVAAALGLNAEFITHGRLAVRPMDELLNELKKHGISAEISVNPGSGENDPAATGRLTVSGQLTAGEYNLNGGVSSQFITGLLFALPLLPGDSVINIEGELKSRPYVDLTLDTLKAAGIAISEQANTFAIKGGQRYNVKKNLIVESDWSNAAAWLCLGAITEGGIAVSKMDILSRQGDRKVLDILGRFGARISLEQEESGLVTAVVMPAPLKGITVDASDIPDIIPYLAVVAAAAEGDTRFINAGRLRIKECDRIMAINKSLSAVGGVVTEMENEIVIHGSESRKAIKEADGVYMSKLLADKADDIPVIETFNDHRIVMMGALIKALSSREVIVCGCNAVSKSYPDFFEDYKNAGGEYEHILR